MDLVTLLTEHAAKREQPPHLSASSITLHMKCPRQWQDKYMFGNTGTPGGALLIGSGFHEGMRRILSGEDLGQPFRDEVAKVEGPISWGRDNYDTCERICSAMLYHYWERVGKFFDPVAVEKEILFYVNGVDLPILGYIDLELQERMVDYKTTAWFNAKQVKVNKDWIWQQAFYQLEVPKPSEVHVITRDKKDPIVVPSSTEHALHFGLLNSYETLAQVQYQWQLMQYHLETYGERPWPGSGLHEYAARWCGVEECCRL